MLISAYADVADVLFCRLITWAASSNVDRGHHWVENCTFKIMFPAVAGSKCVHAIGRNRVT